MRSKLIKVDLDWISKNWKARKGPLNPLVAQGLFKSNSSVPKMKTVSDWIDSCSKEQLKTYQDWFNLADSGFAASLHFILHFLSVTTHSFVFDRRRRSPHHWKWCNQILCSLPLISLSTQAGIYSFYAILLLCDDNAFSCYNHSSLVELG